MFFASVKRIRLSSPGITFFTYTIEGISTRVHHRDRYFKVAFYKKFCKIFCSKFILSDRILLIWDLKWQPVGLLEIIYS